MRRLLNRVVLAAAAVLFAGCVHVGECGPHGGASWNNWLFEDEHSDGRAEQRLCLTIGPRRSWDPGY